MPINVKIPAPMRKYTGGQREVSAQAATINELLSTLDGSYPGLRERICEEDGSVRRFVNIYVKGEDIRFRQGLETPIADGDDISIIPAAAGGAHGSRTLAH